MGIKPPPSRGYKTTPNLRFGHFLPLGWLYATRGWFYPPLWGFLFIFAHVWFFLRKGEVLSHQGGGFIFPLGHGGVILRVGWFCSRFLVILSPHLGAGGGRHGFRGGGVLLFSTLT